MSQCKREGCSKAAAGRGSYCSGACRVAHSRASKKKSVTEPPSVSRESVTDVTVMGKCYNRPAVPCKEFGTRPMPVDTVDRPYHHNRGRYVRTDGFVYQFDCTGRSFEYKHSFTDREGKHHLAVYENVADVREEAA